MARSIHGTPAGLAPALVALIALAALAGGCAASGVLAACGGITSGGTTSGAAPAASANAAAGPTSEQAQRAGADARSILTDLAYAGASPSQKLDLYLPATGTSPYPVILYIHGGGFSGGDKAGGHLAPVLAALSGATPSPPSTTASAARRPSRPRSTTSRPRSAGYAPGRRATSSILRGSPPGAAPPEAIWRR